MSREEELESSKNELELIKFFEYFDLIKVGEKILSGGYKSIKSLKTYLIEGSEEQTSLFRDTVPVTERELEDLKGALKISWKCEDPPKLPESPKSTTNSIPQEEPLDGHIYGSSALHKRSNPDTYTNTNTNTNIDLNTRNIYNNNNQPNVNGEFNWNSLTIQNSEEATKILSRRIDCIARTVNQTRDLGSAGKRYWTAEEKLLVVQFAKLTNNRQAARKIFVDRSTVRDWKKKENELFEMVKNEMRQKRLFKAKCRDGGVLLQGVNNRTSSAISGPSTLY